jgi:hypothetical protein
MGFGPGTVRTPIIHREDFEMAKRPKARSKNERLSEARSRASSARQTTRQAGKKRSGAVRVASNALGSALDSLVNSPRGREILASAIVAAASAAAAALVKSSDSPQVAKAREAVADTADQVASATKDLSDAAAGALAEVVATAMRAILPASVTGFDAELGGRASASPHLEAGARGDL